MKFRVTRTDRGFQVEQKDDDFANDRFEIVRRFVDEADAIILAKHLTRQYNRVNNKPEQSTIIWSGNEE